MSSDAEMALLSQDSRQPRKRKPYADKGLRTPLLFIRKLCKERSPLGRDAGAFNSGDGGGRKQPLKTLPLALAAWGIALFKEIQFLGLTNPQASK